MNPSDKKTTAAALTIAGSDSSGGAGIQADLKTFAAFGVYGASVLTALTAQNTMGVAAIADLEPSFVAAQIDSVLDDLPITAAKTGMLSRREIIEVVAERLRSRPVPSLVVDPVMVAASGDVLLQPDAIESMRTLMLPLAAIITPNTYEAALLAGLKIANPEDLRHAAHELVRMGVRAVLVKGGRFAEGDAVDVFFDGKNELRLTSPRVPVARAHGTGCTLSAAIAASLARGRNMLQAVQTAKRYVTRALQQAQPLGHGATPLNHLVHPDED